MLGRNKRYFRQTENTPLAGTEVSDKIGFGATTNFANEILAVEKNNFEIKYIRQYTHNLG